MCGMLFSLGTRYGAATRGGGAPRPPTTPLTQSHDGRAPQRDLCGIEPRQSVPAGLGRARIGGFARTAPVGGAVLAAQAEAFLAGRWGRPGAQEQGPRCSWRRSKNVQKMPIFGPLRRKVQGEWGGSAHSPDPTAQSAPACVARACVPPHPPRPARGRWGALDGVPPGAGGVGGARGGVGRRAVAVVVPRVCVLDGASPWVIACRLLSLRLGIRVLRQLLVLFRSPLE